LSHVQAIRRLIKSVTTNKVHHAIIISGPPGWSKTTTAEDALRDEGINGISLGAYSTPLNLFNFLHLNSERMILIDDCAKLFTDSASMAILKAATWGNSRGERIIRWGSTTSRALTSEFEFKGKFIIICNSFPETPDGEAIRSRSYLRPITFTGAEARALFIESTKDRERFPEEATIIAVAEFLAERLTDKSVWKISYRTLRAGYDLAVDHPDDWRDLLAPKIPRGADDPALLVKSLDRENLKVKEQVRIFEEATGKSRRTFFKYRQEAKLTRST
jgi:hypothetical protein